MHNPDLIREQTERNAPYPKVEPAEAGMYGFAASGFSLAIFCVLAGIDLYGDARVWFALVVMVIASSVWPYMHFDKQKQRHFREWSRLDSLARERDA